MESTTLQAERRGTGHHEVRELRSAERVPAVVYGSGAAPQTIAVDARSLHKALVAAGSGLIGIQVGKTAVVQVLPREIQRDPVKRHIIHVDFQAVSLTEKLRLHVPIQQTGVAPISNNSDLVLVRVTDSIEIECLPTDIPNHVMADISKLETVDDEILARDLVLPASVRLVTDPAQVIFAVTVARAAVEEEVEAAEPVSAEDVEVIAKGKAAKGPEAEVPEA
jgi:large subunit ribosomal protein L25